MSETKKTDSTKADAVWSDLLKLNNGNAGAAEQACLELTAFPDKKTGEMIRGKSRPHQLSEVALTILRGKVDKALVDYKAEYGDPEPGPTFDDLADEFELTVEPVKTTEKDKILHELGEYYKSNKMIFMRTLKQYNYTTDMLKTKLDISQLKFILTKIKKEATQ